MKTLKFFFNSISIIWVYILPLRNENQLQLWPSQLSKFGLYPTFKEWKHILSSALFIASLRLYPTFKEWKLKHVLTMVR